MDFKLPALLCLLLILQGSYTAEVQKSRMLTTDYVTKSGSVPIQKDSYGYYVNADLAYNYNDASDSEAYDSYAKQFQLGLYTSFTLFSSYCQSFTYYPCSTYGCSLYSGYSSTPSFPDFSVTIGHPMTASLYLDYGNWELGSGNAVSAYQCSSSAYSDGYDRYGIIGLGFNTSLSNYVYESSNYFNSTTFSISLERDGSSGTLLFWSNEDITSSSAYIGQLSATKDLLVPLSSVTVSVGSSSLSTTAGLLFDLNAPQGIGLPYSVYYDVIEYLESVAFTSCDSSYYSSYCSYTGQISSLPTITINIQGVSIPIPPTVYVQGVTDSSTYVSGIILNLRLVDSSYSGYNYVTPAFSNYIILDSSVMSYYYTEFSYNYGSPTITIYNPSSSPSSEVTWPYIVGGVIGGIVIVIILCCCCARRRKNRLSEQARIVVNNGVNTSDQVPLVTNVQVNVPYPAQNYPAAQNQAYPPTQTFPNYGYEQANYGYPQYPNQANVAAYGGYGQPGTYNGNNYMPPQQGQFYGDGQGYTGVPPAQR